MGGKKRVRSRTAYAVHDFSRSFNPNKKIEKWSRRSGLNGRPADYEVSDLWIFPVYPMPYLRSKRLIRHEKYRINGNPAFSLLLWWRQLIQSTSAIDCLCQRCRFPVHAVCTTLLS
jgi:hypothetical protein